MMYFEISLGHGSVRGLFVLLFGFLAAVSYGGLWSYWPWAFLVIGFAPFFEWLTHKYTLHRPLTETPGFGVTIKFGCIMATTCIRTGASCNFAPASAISAMFVQLYASYALFVWLAGQPHAAVLMPLLVSTAYYLLYEWVHLAHHTKAYKPLTGWGEALREAHMRHHFHNENYNWGITNGLGDVLLGTWKGTADTAKSPTAKKLSGYDGS